MKLLLTSLLMATLSLGAMPISRALEKPSAAAHAVNALGVDLLARGTAAGTNTVLSPYSIQSALAMTYAGAAGDTRSQMTRVLHYPEDETALHQSFGELRTALEMLSAKPVEQAPAGAKAGGGTAQPVQLAVANRLFGQQGYKFRPPFLELVERTYGAPLQSMDFIGNANAERVKINNWVEEQTKQRITDLIPGNALTSDSRLVLVNAIHLKAPWAREFPARATQPLPFHLKNGDPVKVDTMQRTGKMGYAKLDGFQAVTVPYLGGELHLLVLLPETRDGLAALEAKLTPELLAACASPTLTEIELSLPKFKLEPPVFKLAETLRSLGMTHAFDDPKGSANFDRMAPRTPKDYLMISEVFHKTYMTLDEKGTEAAAATAVTMTRSTSLIEPTTPVAVRVDHPFLFAIQHRSSGTCLFLGRLCDPRE